MAESQILSVIRVWAAVAWADGVLAEAEAEGLRRLIRTAELTADERARRDEVPRRARSTLPDTYLHEPRRPRRAAASIARRAGWPSSITCSRTPSARCSTGCADLLGIPAEIAQEIEADVPGIEP